MKIGDRVHVKAFVRRLYEGRDLKWVRVLALKKEDALFLGWTHKRDGYESKDDYGYSSPYDFVTVKTTKVAVLQTIGSNDRYLKPVYALPDDVEVM